MLKIRNLSKLLFRKKIWSNANYKAFSTAALLLQHKMNVYWGSQTGTARMFADEFGTEAEMKGYECNIIDLEEFDPNEILDPSFVNVFIMACYGEGQPTDNATNFYKWLMSEERSAEKTAWPSVKYTLFGLGNSETYRERYNIVGKRVDARLEELGANRIFNRGEGDDSKDIQEDFAVWKKNFFDTFKLEETTTEHSHKKIKIVPNCTSTIRPHDPSKEVNAKNPIYVPVISTKQLCEQSMEIEFKTDLDYTTGDHVGIYAKNPNELIDRLVTRLNINIDDNVELHELNGSYKLKDLLENYYDLNSLPSSSLFKVLEKYSNDPEEKQKLAELSDLTKKTYSDFIKKNMMNTVDVLEHYKNITVPFDEVLMTIPKISPRYYSISSSKIANPNLRITVGVLEMNTNSKKFRGLCSYYLSNLQLNDKAGIFIKTSEFRLPKDTKTPLVMIAGGTGIAPFRAFIEERYYLKDKGEELGPAVLFYGCRDDTKVIYHDLLKQALKDKVLSKLFIVYSHMPNGDKPPQLITEKVLEESELVWSLMNDGANLYMCGGKGFGEGCFDSIHNVFLKHTQEGKEREDFDRYIKELRENLRLHEDLAFVN